jgi:hypothetical protein
MAAIALQLAQTISAGSLFFCSGCQRPYLRRTHRKHKEERGHKRKEEFGRNPKPGEANFCLECGRKAALQNADKRRNEREREYRRLYFEEGRSIAEITRIMKPRGGQATVSHCLRNKH